MNLIDEYLKLTQICASTDYADNKSIKIRNKSVERMYEIAEKIGYEQTQETIEDFSKLLDISDNNTNVWAAVHILERVPAGKSIEDKALNIIKQQANFDTADGIGFQSWLENFKKG